jgi:fermentation-respiration switch protein FrsA (DUF1100 family)
VPAYVVLDRFTHHPGETVILLLAPAMGVMLWWGWPRVRRTPWWKGAVYVGVLGAVIAAAGSYAAKMAGGRLLWIEVFWAIYFTVAWRATWAVYQRSVGRWGEPLRRWSRRKRRLAGGARKIADARQRRWARLALGVVFVRFHLVVLVFAPLVLGSLIHRFKIGNAELAGENAALPIESVTFATADGLSLSGWFLPDGDSDVTVIVCHGSGANKGNFIDFLTMFQGTGYNSLIYDARGHGESDGHTSTFGLYEVRDMKAAVDWLKRERPDRSRQVAGLGSSMGAMTLARAAAEDGRIEAVVLDSCFVSAPRLADQHLAPTTAVGRWYGRLVLASMSLHAGKSMWSLDAGAAIARISPRPVFLIHGEEDVIIPPVNMELLYNMAGEPKQKWLGPGPHSNVLTTEYVEYRQRVVDFLNASLHRGPSQKQQ